MGLVDRLERCIARAADSLAERDVAPEAVTQAAVLVSVAAGAALAAGGAVAEPRLWLLVPSLGLGRFVLSIVGSHLEARRRP